MREFYPHSFTYADFPGARAVAVVFKSLALLVIASELIPRLRLDGSPTMDQHEPTRRPKYRPSLWVIVTPMGVVLGQRGFCPRNERPSGAPSISQPLSLLRQGHRRRVRCQD